MSFNDMSPDQLKWLVRDTREVARRVAYKWPGVATADDIEQLILEFLMESRNSSVLSRVINGSDEVKAITLSKVANQLASKERDNYDHFTGNYFYSVDEVKGLLRNGILTSDSEQMASAEAGIDLLEAFIAMTKRGSPYIDVILDHYTNGENISWHKISRALNALTKDMNRSYKDRHQEEAA